MHKIYLGLGSNYHALDHLAQARERLQAAWGDLLASPIYESNSISDHSRYANQVVRVNSAAPVEEILTKTKTIERELGRTRSSERVSIDIDVLLVGHLTGRYQNGPATATLPHPDIELFSHVLVPLLDIEPDCTHPGTGKRYATGLSKVNRKNLQKL